jgi:hypothetical protein
MEIRTEIEIDAPPGAVWRVLTDLRHYPDWNPFIVNASGALETDARLELTTVEPESNRERSFRARILKCEPERELRFLYHSLMKGVLDHEHFLLLAPSQSGGTRLVHGQNESGLFLKFALASVTRRTRGLAYMNMALKRRVENGGRR